MIFFFSSCSSAKKHKRYLILTAEMVYVLMRSGALEYTAILRKVVGKSARDNPERYCG